MVEGVKLSQEQLVDRFGVSRRLAGRVGALQARGVGVSAAFLETARPGFPAERLLLKAELLREAPGLTPERFRRLAEGHLRPDEPAALITNPDGSRVIALVEEVEVQQAEPVKTGDSLPTVFSPVGTGLRAIGEEESRRLFTPEEITRLKVTVLTSADPGEKIEAIRRLALSPLNAGDKAIVLVHGLADNDAAVRVEAAEALTALGLTPGVSAAARSLGEGNVKQRLRAAERMAALAEEVSESEISVILTMLAGAINGEESAEVKTALIRSFKGACEVVARSPACAAELLGLLVRQLEGAPEVLYRPVREILGEVGRCAPDMMTELIAGELSAIKAPALRRMLFGVLAVFPVPEGRRAELASLGVADFEGSETPEEECQGIGSMLIDWGAAAVAPLVAALPDAEDAPKIYMVRLLDEIVCHRGGEEAAEEAGEALLNLLRVSSKHVRLPIIETSVITHPKLRDELKMKIADELLGSLAEFANPRMRSVIETATQRLGEAALASIKRLLVEEDDHEKRESACRVMAEIVANCEEPRRRASIADDMLQLCLEQWQAAHEKKGYLAETIGKLCAFSFTGPEQLAAIADDMKAAVFNTAEPFGVLLALGNISASPKLDTKSRFDIAGTFFDLLDVRLPELTDKVLASTTNDDDEVHHFGGEVTAYTEMIPACLEGLEKTYLGTEARSLRGKIVEFLVRKWNETSSWTTIWGPEALEMLMRTLSRIARHSSSDCECAGTIVEALAQRLDFLPVVKELDMIFASGRSSARIGAAACKVGRRLVRRASSGREGEPGVVLKTLGTIAARTGLGTDPDEARRLRERTVQVLYSGLKEGRAEAVEALQQMKDCPALPASSREEIRIRLDILAEAEKRREGAGPGRDGGLGGQ